jgi:hypothetical protein
MANDFGAAALHINSVQFVNLNICKAISIAIALPLMVKFHFGAIRSTDLKRLVFP